METRASYLLVGGFVLALIAAGFAFVMWLARVEFEESSRYVVYFTDSVTGLGIGSPVRFRGVPIGSVSDIRIDPENVERIRVTLEVTSGTPIKTDTVASLGLQGITGVAFIQLTGGTQSSSLLQARPGNDLPVIESKDSALQTVLEKAPQMLERLVALAERLSRLVDDRNVGAVAETLENIRALSESLAGRRDSLERIITESEATMVAVRGASENINRLSGELRTTSASLRDGVLDAVTDTQVTLTDIREMARSIASVAEGLDRVVEDNREPMRDFSATGLYELSQFVAEARVLVASLTRLSAQIEQDPARFFFGDAQKGFEAR